MTHISYVVLVVDTVRRVLLPDLPATRMPKAKDMTAARLTMFFALLVVSTVIVTPLEVIVTRLAIQRNHSAAEFNSVTQEEGDGEECGDYGGSEDVIG